MRKIFATFLLLASATTSASAVTCLPTQRAYNYAISRGYTVELLHGRAADDLIRTWMSQYGEQQGKMTLAAAVKKNGSNHLFVGNADTVCGPL